MSKVAVVKTQDQSYESIKKAVAVTAPFSNDYGTAHQLAESCSARQLSPPHLVDVVSDFIS